VTVASLTFNQSGETRASATETLDALQGFVCCYVLRALSSYQPSRSPPHMSRSGRTM